MINTGIIYNLIAQDLIKEYNIFKNNKVSSLTAAKRGKICFFKHYYVAIEAYEHNGLWTSDRITILNTNIIGRKLIWDIS